MTARQAALAIWRAGLAAGEVGRLLRARVRRDGSRLSVGALTVDLDQVARVIVLGCGKASAAIARVLEEVLGDRITTGLVVVKDGHQAPTRTVRVVEAAHPVPDGRGVAAASDLLALAAGARRDDLVIVLLSGGGSALAPAPAPPITLAEKQALTRSLMAAGATIREL